MQQLEELLQNPQIYENLSLFKDFIKGVKKLCDQFEDKIKMIPKQEQYDEEQSKKEIVKQNQKKIKKSDIPNKNNETNQEEGEGKVQFDTNQDQIEKLSLEIIFINQFSHKIDQNLKQNNEINKINKRISPKRSKNKRRLKQKEKRRFWQESKKRILLVGILQQNINEFNIRNSQFQINNRNIMVLYLIQAEVCLNEKNVELQVQALDQLSLGSAQNIINLMIGNYFIQSSSYINLFSQNHIQIQTFGDFNFSSQRQRISQNISNVQQSFQYCQVVQICRSCSGISNQITNSQVSEIGLYFKFLFKVLEVLLTFNLRQDIQRHSVLIKTI